MKYFIHLFILITIVAGCNKYQELADADYPDQVIYMSTAGSIYVISGPPNTVEIPTPGSSSRFRIDESANKVIIPLGVLRGGINYNGSVGVEITNSPDTVNTLISEETLSAQLLPSSTYNIPTSVTLLNGQSSASFDIAVDRDFLLNNPGTSYAFGVSISSRDRETNPDKKTTVILLHTDTFMENDD